MRSHTARAEVGLGLEPADHSPFSCFPHHPACRAASVHASARQETTRPEAGGTEAGEPRVRALPLTRCVTRASHLISLGLRSKRD